MKSCPRTEEDGPFAGGGHEPFREEELDTPLWSVTPLPIPLGGCGVRQWCWFTLSLCESVSAHLHSALGTVGRTHSHSCFFRRWRSVLPAGATHRSCRRERGQDRGKDLCLLGPIFSLSFLWEDLGQGWTRNSHRCLGSLRSACMQSPPTDFDCD